jgi:hypothetical protein
MKKTIEYEVRYDLAVEITYLGEENPGEHYFRLHRHWTELTFDDEEDEAIAYVDGEGKLVGIEGYDYLRDEERQAIEEIMSQIKLPGHD